MSQNMIKCSSFECQKNDNGFCKMHYFEIGENGICIHYMVPDLTVINGGKTPQKTTVDPIDFDLFMLASNIWLAVGDYLDIAYKQMERFHIKGIDCAYSIHQNLYLSRTCLNHLIEIYWVYFLTRSINPNPKIFAFRTNSGYGRSPKYDALSYIYEKQLPPAIVFVIYDYDRFFYYWNGAEVHRLFKRQCIDQLEKLGFSASPF